MSRLADKVEAEVMEAVEELIEDAAEPLPTEPYAPSDHELRLGINCLVHALRDVHRIAVSRGERLGH